MEKYIPTSKMYFTHDFWDMLCSLEFLGIYSIFSVIQIVKLKEPGIGKLRKMSASPQFFIIK